jgi:hypothetical protein
MTRKLLLPTLFAGAALVSLAAQAKVFTLKSVEVELPESSRTLPDGPGVTVVHDNCLSCHSVGMILTQPTMAKPAWEAEVNKMRNVYKAPVDEKDVPAIVDYLTAVKGPK